MSKTAWPLVLGLVVTMSGANAVAADKPYTDGTIWTMTMIRVKPGEFEKYMREVIPARMKVADEAKKEGLLLSDHLLTGQASNESDFDFVILEEFKNWAVLDGLDEKFEAIRDRIGITEDQETQKMEQRVEFRTIVGGKTFQEIVPKP
jgi:hypothetical protein